MTKTVQVKIDVEVTVDESKFTDEWLEEFRERFYYFRTIDDHIEHLAQLKARDIFDRYPPFIEGYENPINMGISAKIVDAKTEII
jgi:hypothetical protein